ncbi:MAG: hypothetical protein NWE99_06615 [Candidatus Bathyarchaeota archaeon]|nr:hypothetical protein [Candidatus Bathyarchaeota archaeon]
MPIITVPGLPGLYDLLLLLLLVVVGLVIIIVLAKVLLFILPGAIIAFVVWLLTGSLLWAGIAFLIVSFISIAKR